MFGRGSLPIPRARSHACFFTLSRASSRLSFIQNSFMSSRTSRQSLAILLAVLLLGLLFLPLLAAPSANAAGSVSGQKELTTATQPPQQDGEGKYIDLVFSGGGAKGLALIGAVRELEKQGYQYNRLVGTSAGTIMAMLVAAGYSADELEVEMLKRSDDGSIVMASFLAPSDSYDSKTIRNSLTFDVVKQYLPILLPENIKANVAEQATKMLLRIPVFREIFSFIEFGGVYSGDRSVEWLAKRLDAEGRHLADSTFQEFYEKTGSDLTVVATDSTLGEMLILNHRTAPDLPVIEAARMSTAIPFVFEEVEWQPEWGAYQDKDISGHLVVDGGLSSNLAIELVLSLQREILGAMGGAPDRSRVIGLYLDPNLSVDGIADVPITESNAQKHPITRHWHQILDRSSHVLDTMLRSHDHFIASSYPLNVCHIPVKGYGTMDFQLSDEAVKALIDAGQGAMAECMAQRNDIHY